MLTVTTTWLSFTIHFISNFCHTHKNPKENPTPCQKRWKLPKWNRIYTCIEWQWLVKITTTQVSSRTRPRVKWHQSFANAYFKFIYHLPLTPHVPSFNPSWHFDRHIQHLCRESQKKYVIVFRKFLLPLQQTWVLPTLPVLPLKCLRSWVEYKSKGSSELVCLNLKKVTPLLP